MFAIDHIDKTATFRAVEKAFTEYRIYRFAPYNESEPAIVQSYEPRYHGSTNVTSDQTANVALKNVYAAEVFTRCKKIEETVNKLHPFERLIIEHRYMKDYVKDYQVYNFIFNPPISEKTYRKIRWNAVQRIAHALDIVVYRTKKVV